MIDIRSATQNDNHLIPDLCALLRDAVDGGASVGFLAPLAPSMAAAYWCDTLASAGPGLVVWVALEHGRVVGSVQLALSGRENGRHRAEVQKLLVLASSRRKGIARQLMSVLESHARNANRTLLVLDTQDGSAAESLYQRLGWSKAGEIPDFAAAPDGALRATALYFKQLGASVAAILQSGITCPDCVLTSIEDMPTDACVRFYECQGCGRLLEPMSGDCCVFCSFGSVKCPPVQLDEGCCGTLT